jgi:uncharacterized protein (DUF58 family)
MSTAQETLYLEYRMRGRAGDARPGKHAARHRGYGGDFRAHLPFWQLPDAARIDVRRSIMDPGGNLLVRQMEQRSAIDVVVAVDVSRSMAARRGINTLAEMALLASAAARAALRAGDAFGLLAFDDTLRSDLCLAPSRTRSACRMAIDALSRVTTSGRSAQGLMDLAAYTPSRRCLLILVSDFLMPLTAINQSLTLLAAHDVAPIVLNGAGMDGVPYAGLLRMRDAETNVTRLLLMRPALHRRWHEAETQRRAQLNRLFGAHCRAPLHVSGPIDILRVSQHLLQG